MNYIEQLMKENNIDLNEKFAIVGGNKYNEHDKIFYFNNKYALVSNACTWEKKHIYYHSSMLIKLLIGEYKICP